MRAFYSVPLALLALAIATAASAGVPSPLNSSVPSCLQVCPYGDLTYTVVIRDLANNPVGGATVVLDFLDCQTFHLCPPPSPPNTTLIANAQGVATFALKGGGGCANAVRVFADGVLMASGVSVASPDQDGDLFVTGLDQAALLLKGPADPTADLNCDGVHDAADGNVQVAHMGHYCDGVIPVAPRSWGQLKVHYR
jgi:hypothetical protein